MKKAKVQYKRGDPVVFIRLDSYGVTVTDGVVSQVRTDPAWGLMVYVKHKVSFRPGDESIWNYAFVEKLGHDRYVNSTSQYPLWMLRPLRDGENIKRLQKRANHATNLHKQYRTRYDDISRQVEYEAAEWKRQQIEQRTKDLPHSWPFLENVVSRMGFKKPREKVNHVVTAR